MYICLCRGITDKDLLELKKKMSKKQIYKNLELGSSCGSCIGKALNILENPTHQKKDPSPKS
ncbi:MAG: hypothetical protein HOE90_09940 [Bacteriovoracaceae bacterium]|jgi:bacterioferritin-associated ferredoxin|nr:hypothetical protein [Bacteriovoracaceae bacterium]